MPITRSTHRQEGFSADRFYSLLVSEYSGTTSPTSNPEEAAFLFAARQRVQRNIIIVLSLAAPSSVSIRCSSASTAEHHQRHAVEHGDRFLFAARQRVQRNVRPGLPSRWWPGVSIRCSSASTAERHPSWVWFMLEADMFLFAARQRVQRNTLVIKRGCVVPRFLFAARQRVQRNLLVEKATGSKLWFLFAARQRVQRNVEVKGPIHARCLFLFAARQRVQRNSRASQAPGWRSTGFYSLLVSEYSGTGGRGFPPCSSRARSFLFAARQRVQRNPQTMPCGH